MNKLEFENIKNKLKDYKFNSLEYRDYDEVENYNIAVDNENVLIVVGYNEEHGIKEFHWAANNWSEVATIIQKEAVPILVTFIPEPWKEDYIKLGFKEYAIYREYWIEDIQRVSKEKYSYSVINESEITAASQVTIECRGQSRGFQGETPEWIEAWINGSEDGLVSAKDSTILVYRENDEVLGVVCLAIYGHGSEKGPILWVRELAVAPKSQGQGIGRKLLNQALTYGIDHGAKRGFLMADECNFNAKKLYEDIGFIPSVDEVQIDMIYEGK